MTIPISGTNGAIDGGSKMGLSDLQCQNALSLTRLSRLSRSNITLSSFTPSAKQKSERISIPNGRRIDSSTEQSANARSPSCDSRDPASKATATSFEQPAKHSLEMTSTDAGTQIDFSDEQFQKTRSGRIAHRQPSSKATSARAQQSAKQPRATVRIDAGTQIEPSSEQCENACSSIANIAPRLTRESLRQQENADAEMVWTDGGTEIERRNGQYAKEWSPMTDNVL
jgi:hypothetical protein